MKIDDNSDLIKDVKRVSTALIIFLGMGTFWIYSKSEHDIKLFWWVNGATLTFAIILFALRILPKWWTSIAHYDDLVISSDNKIKALEETIEDYKNSNLSSDEESAIFQRGREHGICEAEGQVLASWAPIPELFTADDLDGKIMLVGRISGEEPLLGAHYAVARKDTNKERASVKIYKIDSTTKLVHLEVLQMNMEYFGEAFIDSMRTNPEAYVRDYKLIPIKYSLKIADLVSFENSETQTTSKTEEI